MNLPGRILSLSIAVFFGGIAAAQDKAPVKPLFADEGVLNLTIEASFKDLVRKQAKSTTPYPARFSWGTDDQSALEGTVAARGKSRRTRGICQFPPLRIRFPDRPDSGVFKGQKSLKLVTHCKDKNSYEDHVWLEYSAYQLLNVLTEASHRVRLTKVQYVDGDSGKVLAHRHGFFIEDTDDLATRNGQVELDLPGTRHGNLDQGAAARIELFQYMLGNLDFSLVKAPPGSDCCHNSKLIGLSNSAASPQIPVPYDFDNTGWVDPDYALLPGNVDVRDIRTRVFRGHCSRIDQVREQRNVFIDRKSVLAAVIENLSGLSDKQKAKNREYLKQFFETLEDGDRFERKVVKACR